MSALQRTIAHIFGGHHYVACRGRNSCADSFSSRRIFRRPGPRHAKPPRRTALLTIETIEGGARRTPRPPRHLRSEP